VSAPERGYRVTTASTIEAMVPKFLWEDRVPVGTISIAAGRGGEGKSSFAIWMAAEISNGTLPGAFYGTPRDTLYVSGEDHWGYMMLPRLIAAGADLTRIHRLDVLTPEGDETTPILPVDVSLLKAAISETGSALVVIDPLLSTMSGDTYKASDMRQALEPLKRVIEDAEATALGILHFSKSVGTHAGNAINGSTAFRDIARSVFLFARDLDTETRVCSQDKNSYARDDLPSLEYMLESTLVPIGASHADVGKFVWLGESTQSVRDIMNATEDATHDDRGEAEQWLLSYLESAGGTAAANDILKAGASAGYSRDVLKRAGRKITNKAKSGFQGAWSWSLDLTKGAQREQREHESLPVHPSHPLLPLGGICAVCGKQSHSANAAFDFVHPDCDVA
jgi:hypothetical protein